MLREWMTLFVAGIPLDEVAFGPPPPTDGPPPPAGDAPEEEQLVVEAEIDEYLAQASEWAPDALAAAPLPDDLPTILAARDDAAVLSLGATARRWSGGWCCR